MDVDVTIVGAGVIGLAVAERLSRSSRSVLVLEKARSFGSEISSRNSQVVHAGMYYPTGTLKAALCVAGNRSLYAWCDAHGVPVKRVGKLIVATEPEEESKLQSILAQGGSNGVPNLELISGARAMALEPGVRATAALHSPDTGIVDGHGFMASLLAEARTRRCDVAWQHALVAVERKGDGYALEVADATGARMQLRTRVVVNAAGLDGDELAALAGIDVDAAGYRLSYVKGSYFRVRGRGLATRLIYPVPLPGLRGLGVHLTLELDGSCRLGPDVEAVAGRARDYDVSEHKARAFFETASRYLPGLGEADLYPDQAGIRPKLVPPDGGVGDFVVAEESARGLPGWVNLIGIESPGLTASLEVAARVESLLA
jgi:L-2-hydroxyglutarate oxidase LhgO